jgi:hypothetical protein
MMSAIVIMAGFAAVWWIGGGVVGHAPLGLVAVGPAISVILIFVARARLKNAPQPGPDERKRAGRIIGWASGVEGLALALAGHLLITAGLSAYVASAIAVIVGLHFLPLAKLLPVPIYYLTALLLVLAGLAGLAIDVAHRPLAISMTAAVVLWLTCWVRMAKPAPSAASAD